MRDLEEHESVLAVFLTVSLDKGFLGGEEETGNEVSK